MWKCNKCGANVESTKTVCPYCGASQFKLNGSSDSSAEAAKSFEKISISSGLERWVIVYYVCAIILFFASFYFLVTAVSEHKSYCFEEALIYLCLGISSLFMVALTKGFGYIIKAAKLYLKKNGEPID